MPQPIIQTKRLILRPFLNGDATAIARLANDPQIAKMTASIRYPYPAIDAVRFVRFVLKQPDSDTGPYLMTLKSNPRFIIGLAGLHAKKGRPLIGYWVGAAHRKRGYASEAARALLVYGFETLKFDQIEIACRVGNAGSKRIIEKLGGRRPRLRMDWSRMLSRRVPTLAYMLRRDDWQRRRTQRVSGAAT